jgi:hypothetical protein
MFPPGWLANPTLGGEKQHDLCHIRYEISLSVLDEDEDEDKDEEEGRLGLRLGLRGAGRAAQAPG